MLVAFIEPFIQVRRSIYQNVCLLCEQQIVQWLRTFTALSEDLGLIPSTHTVAQNHV